MLLNYSYFLLKYLIITQLICLFKSTPLPQRLGSFTANFACELAIIVIHQLYSHFRIGFGIKGISLPQKLVLQLLVISMIPLCTPTTLRSSLQWGWALVSLGSPWVAQRVCPTPQVPARAVPLFVSSPLI